MKLNRFPRMNLDSIDYDALASAKEYISNQKFESDMNTGGAHENQ